MIKDYPDHLKDLLQSDLRKQLFNEIIAQNRPFSIVHLIILLNKKGIKVSRNTLQQFIQSLLMRRVLRAYTENTNQKGRPRLILKMMEDKIQGI